MVRFLSCMVDFLVAICRDVYCKNFQGRTVREFILGVLLVPSLISFIWLTAFGGTANKLDGFVKLVLESGNGKILGAHIFGPEAGELIHELITAMNFGATVYDL